MFFDDRNTFENWAETLPAYDTHDRHGCACCSALPSLLAEQFDDIEQLTQPEHWGEGEEGVRESFLASKLAPQFASGFFLSLKASSFEHLFLLNSLKQQQLHCVYVPQVKSDPSPQRVV